jgi:lipopolysaccharide transport system ATP-binding protein
MTTSINANDLCVDFPIFSFTGNRSLKKTILNIATGGVIGADVKNNLIVSALSDINLTIPEGSRVGLIGHNGSGKTTLLQVLAGIYEPTSGSLNVSGKISSMLGITIGMNMEESGLDNIYLKGAYMGLTKKDIDCKVDEIIEFSGLGDFIHLPVKTYSSGMCMRLAFSIVTNNDFDIVLMDEWLSAGDSDFILKANKRMDEIVKKARIVVVASHNHQMIQERCNMVIQMDHGKIISTNFK